MAKKKKERKEEKKKEKIFTIPLGPSYHAARTKRTKSAVSRVKRFLEKNLKNDVRLAKELNEFLWKRGIQKPPRSVKVKVSEEGETLTATLVK